MRVGTADCSEKMADLFACHQTLEAYSKKDFQRNARYSTPICPLSSLRLQAEAQELDCILPARVG
jgi:hypothetical protein